MTLETQVLDSKSIQKETFEINITLSFSLSLSASFVRYNNFLKSELAVR